MRQFVVLNPGKSVEVAPTNVRSPNSVFGVTSDASVHPHWCEELAQLKSKRLKQVVTQEFLEFENSLSHNTLTAMPRWKIRIHERCDTPFQFSVVTFFVSCEAQPQNERKP